MMKKPGIRVFLLLLIAGMLFAEIPRGVFAPRAAQAQGTPVNGIVALFNVIGAARRRNRVYREARATQGEMDAYYDGLIEEAQAQLQERELAGGLTQGNLTLEERGQLRVYIKMYEALAAEREAVTRQIESEKNDARRQFNRNLTNEVVGILVKSPGGQRLIGDLRSTIGELREAVASIQQAIANNQPFDLLAQSLQSKVEDIPILRGAAYELGQAAGHKLDQLLGGVITQTQRVLTNIQGGMNDALQQINQIDGELARLDERERTPVSLVEEGSLIGRIRGVDRANAAVDVAAQAYTNAAIIANNLGGLSEAERSTMRDRIRDQLLQERLDRLSQVGRNSSSLACSGVGQGEYQLAMLELGRTPETPLDPARAGYLVCRDRDSGAIVHAALIGPAAGSEATATVESTAEEMATAMVEGTPEEERCSLSGNGDFVIEGYSLSSRSNTCEDLEYPLGAVADPLLLYLAATGRWVVSADTPAGLEWAWEATQPLDGAVVQGEAKIVGTELRITANITALPGSSIVPDPAHGNGFALMAIFPLIPLFLGRPSSRRRRFILLGLTLVAFLLMAQSCEIYGDFHGSYTFPLPEDGFACEIPAENPNLAEMPGSSGQVGMNLTIVDDEGEQQSCSSSAAVNGIGVLKRDGFYTQESLE
jgi:tetratricopeptide (TPR) repeat protein